MNFEELTAEVYARGFASYEATESARVKRWINQAIGEICDTKPWPFLQATKEGTGPLTIADLGHALTVTNITSGEQIPYVPRTQIVGRDPDLNETGIAQCWYQEGETQLAVWPKDTASKIQVRYTRVPPELVANADTPLIPTRFHDVIVDGAVIKAYKSNDNFESAQLVRQEWERGMRTMLSALLKPNLDNARSIVRSGLPGDYQ